MTAATDTSVRIAGCAGCPVWKPTPVLGELCGLDGKPRPRVPLDVPAFGPVCYVVDDARPLPSPIACNGARGLWRTDPAHQAALGALVSPC